MVHRVLTNEQVIDAARDIVLDSVDHLTATRGLSEEERDHLKAYVRASREDVPMTLPTEGQMPEMERLMDRLVDITATALKRTEDWLDERGLRQ